MLRKRQQKASERTGGWRLLAVLSALLLLAAPLGAKQIQPACPVPLDPAPSGVTDRPDEDFGDEGDFYFMHSSTHLQGRLATEKFASGLLYDATSTPPLDGFHSAVIVNNPSPSDTLTVDIEYYDEGGGTPISTSSVTLPPDATHVEQATPLLMPINPGAPVGRGSARIVSTNGKPFVGGSILHTHTFDDLTDPESFALGATSMQQLQERQDAKTRLYWGPIPTTNTTPIDGLNGLLPFFWVANPNPVPNTVRIFILSRNGTNLGSTTVTIPAYASHLDLTLLGFLMPIYVGGGVSFDDDFLVTVNSLSGLPILGDGVMTDFFSDDDPFNLNYGDRFRMASMMLATTPALIVTNPELIHDPVGVPGSAPPMTTVMGLLNAGSGNVGPVRIEYRDRDGVVLGVDTVGSLPRGGMVRIGSGLPATPNYPSGPVFAGWVRIRACKVGLVGWTMREVLHDASVGANHPKKLYGEDLHGSNGAEPGVGFVVDVDDGQGPMPWVRKVSPLVRVSGDGGFWPGYTTFVNDSVSNIGDYWFRFFRLDGTDVTDATPAIGVTQPFAGLQWGDTSFTHEDSPLNLNTVFGFETLSGRVDQETGRIKGIDAIGDPIVEWGIGFPEAEPVE